MSADLYSGAIDWERVYRTFHAPSQVAARIRQALPGTGDGTIFCGFQETAGLLANDLPVTFVDYAPAITAHARAEYPGLRAVVTGDITRLVATLPNPYLVIACRISAYWDAPEYFERLSASLRAYPRDLVLIDFFDLDRVAPGQRFVFESGGCAGEWVVLDVDAPLDGEPPISLVRLKVSYAFDDYSFSYTGVRAFLPKAALLRWSQARFPGYDVTLGPPLVEGDPGFSLKLIRKGVF